MDKTATERNRRNLIDMAAGNRSGYWVEILHHDTDGAVLYMLHTPWQVRPEYANGRTWRDLPPLWVTTWDGIRVQMERYEKDAEAAELLPKYDEQRTYVDGQVWDAETLRGFMRWVKVDE